MDVEGMYQWMRLVWKKCIRRRVCFALVSLFQLVTFLSFFQLLIMDGFGAHTHDGVMRRLNGEYNTEVVILPPNTSYRLQPLDGGPNRSFKAFMRRQLRRRMIDIENKDAPTDADMCVVAVQGLIVFLILCSSGIYHPRVHQEILLSTVWRGRQSGTRFD